MSLHGRGVEGERTLPFPAAGAPPVAGPVTPPIWSPPPPPPPYPGPYTYPGPYSNPYSGGGGPWQPPGGPGLPPPNRGRAALLVVAIVLAVVILVVAVSYAVVGGSQHPRVTTTAPVLPGTPSPSPSDTTSPPAAVLVPPATPAPATVAPSTPAPQAASKPLTAAGIAALIDPSVVDVNSILGFQGGTAAGTGMVLSSTGAILTNNHVIDGASAISVQIPGTGRIYAATVVSTDVNEDVAVLQLQGASGLKVAPFGDSSKVLVGDRVVALGNALGRAGPPSVSQGLVLGLNRDITATDPTAGTSENLMGLIQTSATLQPGDSGGPLINETGQVIGMDTAASSRIRFNSGGGGGFAIPINHALQIAAVLRAGGGTVPSLATSPAVRAYLGVQVQQNFSGPGTTVAGIVAGSPAEAAGIAVGDAIVGVDGTAVTSPSSLTSLLAGHHPGDTVRVTWVDGLGRRHSASIRLASAP